jgi:hypothetical protein
MWTQDWRVLLILMTGLLSAKISVNERHEKTVRSVLLQKHDELLYGPVLKPRFYAEFQAGFVRSSITI